MSGSTRRCIGQAALLIVAVLIAAPVDAEFADLAARADYGFHAGEASVIDGVMEPLERLAADGRSDVSIEAGYWLAFASYREAALRRPRNPQAAQRSAARCVELAESVAPNRPWQVEAAILAAACLQLVATDPLRSVLQQRRIDRWLNDAALADRDNPRLALVRGLLASAGEPGRAESDQASAEPWFAEAVRLFDERQRPRARRLLPDVSWGEPEALAYLAAIRLDQQRIREARDLIEHALLLAPDYHFARQLNQRLRAGTSEPAR